MSWTLTYTGKKFYPESPQSCKYDIRDIAHALSNLCRFSGHTRKFYSVAQHSVLVSRIIESRYGVNAGFQLGALLHDATEAYLVDLPQPIKRLESMWAYRELEERVAVQIENAFGVHIESDIIKLSDQIALATEARDLMNDPKDWPSLQGIEPMPERIKPLLPAAAKELFLERYLELTHGR